MPFSLRKIVRDGCQLTVGVVSQPLLLLWGKDSTMGIRASGVGSVSAASGGNVGNDIGLTPSTLNKDNDRVGRADDARWFVAGG